VLDLDWSQPALEQINDKTEGLIFAAGIGATDAQLQKRLRVAFELAKGLPELALFATITGMGGTFGHERCTGAALQGALPGLVKTLAQERTNTRCLAIDIDTDTLDASAVIQTLESDSGVIEVGLTDEPITLQASPITLNPDTTPSHPVEAGDLIVVSGGARGVTAMVVQEMARRWQPSFLLLGRSEWPEVETNWAQDIADEKLNAACLAHLKDLGEPFKPTDIQKAVNGVLKGREMHANITALRALNIDVEYRAVNVRDGDSVAQAITDVSEKLGPVRGIVHGAGVIADKLIDEKTMEQFDFVFGTKVEGLQNLIAAVDMEHLKLMAVFSSVAGRYGNRGQVDYAMANEAITHLTHQHAATHGLNAKAFHWGPWAGGMVTSALKAALEARGMEVIPLQAGAQQFCDEFERGGPTVEVVIGGPDQAAGLLGQAETTRTFPPLEAGSKTHTIDGSLGFLDDHRIGGKPVLPFVMVLEWIVAAAQETYPEYHIAGVRDLAVLKGIVLDESNKTLTLEWTPTGPSGNADGALSFRLLGDIGPMNLPMVHYKGTVELSRTQMTTNRFPGSNGLGKSAYPYSVKEAYERFLFHGPGLQGIHTIVGMSDHGIVGTLGTSRPKQLGVNKTLWETDPVALDSALQLVGLWVREKRGASALPCYVEEYQQYAPFRSEVTCHIEMEPTKNARGRFQATFVDAQGRVVASVNGGQYASRKGLNDNFKTTSTPNEQAN
jgi:NAD(P)-dependent dehydrogenase (short-subunit alcohol dehydrogenase family)